MDRAPPTSKCCQPACRDFHGRSAWGTIEPLMCTAASVPTLFGQSGAPRHSTNRFPPRHVELLCSLFTSSREIAPELLCELALGDSLQRQIQIPPLTQQSPHILSDWNDIAPNQQLHQTKQDTWQILLQTRVLVLSFYIAKTWTVFCNWIKITWSTHYPKARNFRPANKFYCIDPRKASASTTSTSHGTSSPRNAKTTTQHQLTRTNHISTSRVELPKRNFDLQHPTTTHTPHYTPRFIPTFF